MGKTSAHVQSASSARMLILGLDAADPALIEKWCDEGILPALKFLRAQGAWVRLQHDGAMPSASVWPSIYSGTYPGKHGIYNGLQLAPGKRQVRLLEPSECARPPFWQIIDQSGKASIIVDVPFSYPLKDFRGIQILDWGSYERHYESHSLPREILTEICQRFGSYPFGHEMSRDAPASMRHFSRARAQLLAGAALKGSVVKWLTSDRPWDLFMAVFSETHPAGHYFWTSDGNGHGRSPGAARAQLTTTMQDVYKAIDGEIGKIIDGIDENVTLVVLSGQGMGPNNARWHVIPEVLSELGVLALNTKNGRNHRLGELRDSIPLRWRRSISRQLPGRWRDRLRTHWATARIDWSRTRAFHLPTDQLGYVRINLRGREPQGIVEPGADYRDLCDTISDALKGLVDTHTGRKIVREVFRADQLFPGPARHRLPDLLVSWQDEPGQQTLSARFDGVNGALDMRAGNHRPEGFAVFYGRGVCHGQFSQGHIVDLAPTVLTYFGLTPPADMDGRALPGIFS
ncbi:MAG TPA: alkaline phosphatase family protein [Candidatus Binatia bacterium]